jgi:hypothetical protein
MTTPQQNRPLLTPQELAWLLNRHPNYVYLMKKAGFPMPGYRASLESALKWLEENPNWRRNVVPNKQRAAAKG